MRKPDKTEVIQHKGQDVIVDVWIDATDLPYDGDNPEDAEGCEGWDVLVKATHHKVHRFEGVDSLGSIWIRPGDKYLDECVAECTRNALLDLEETLTYYASGMGLKLAQAKMEDAITTLHLMKKEEDSK